MTELSIVIAAGGQVVTSTRASPWPAPSSGWHQTRASLLSARGAASSRLIPDAGHHLHLVDMIPLARNVGLRRFLLPAYFARAAAQARAILRREEANVAVGMGGYASIPLIAGARLARVPSLIHESGAVPGRANRLAARLTQNVATAFDMTGGGRNGFSRRVTTRTVGMPLGTELASFDRNSVRAAARAAFGVTDTVKMLLINGGSQGSARLNDAAVGLACRWNERDDVHIVVKAGRTNVDEVERRLKEVGGESIATCVAYLERMDHTYAAADLAVCRAGAGTIAELAVVGLPAVLIPYPHAPDDHQAVNAAVLVEAGAAVLVRDGDATAELLGPQIEDLLDHPDRIMRMAAAARSQARPHAAEALAAWVLELGTHG